jgi:2-polyprenyl-3-methyl-5-hydroxy-6-metoxy-1,4-benzoquinol methylase
MNASKDSVRVNTGPTMKEAFSRILKFFSRSAGSGDMVLNPFERFQTGISYNKMSKREIRKDLNARYETGNAYPNPALWIHVHHQQLEAVFRAFLADKVTGKHILEIGCGLGGIAAHNIRDAARIIATDLSDTALATARAFFHDRRELSFFQMDSENLTFDDASFDIAIAKEVLEHLSNPETCLASLHRVLRPGGYLALSTPNRDSFHLRVNRKLGRSDFKCSGDHIKEFTYSEMVEMLESAGFSIEKAEGVTLSPFHYVPDVFPDRVKALEDDPEFVEWMRVLGQRAGAEFGFCFVILARKR